MAPEFVFYVCYFVFIVFFLLFFFLVFCFKFFVGPFRGHLCVFSRDTWHFVKHVVFPTVSIMVFFQGFSIYVQY